MRTRAQIVALRQETPTVRGLTLALRDPDFTFLAGQWVDVSVLLAGRPQVGGYSITSSPLHRGTIELAVKRVGANAVTRYIHGMARVGDVLVVDGGHGEFVYTAAMGGPLLMVAGGIGTTPLMSMVRYAAVAAPEVPVTLVYSARSPEELVFRAELEERARGPQRLRCLFTVTGPAPAGWTHGVGRVSADLLREAGAGPDSLCYVCGPPPMIEATEAALRGLGVRPERLRTERWW